MFVDSFFINFNPSKYSPIIPCINKFLLGGKFLLNSCKAFFDISIG